MILIAFLFRVALALVFLRAGLLKLLSRPAFRDAVANYDLIPEGMVESASWFAPLLELLGGSLLLLGIELRVVGLSLGALLAVFCGAIAVNLLRGRIIACGCSGAVAADISWRHVALNCLWAAAAVVVAICAAEPLSVLPGLHDPYESAAWTSRALAAALVMTLASASLVLIVEARRALKLMSPKPSARA